MNNLLNKKVGDMVYMDCYTSMGASAVGNVKILDIEIRYDTKTGKEFALLLTEEDTWDSRTGEDYKNKQSMYYIS